MTVNASRLRATIFGTWCLKPIALSAFVLLGGTGLARAQACGDGSDGALTVSGNTTLAGGTYQYSTVTVEAGATLTVTGNTPLVINATGVVAIGGAIVAVGANGTDGQFGTQGGTGGAGATGGGQGGNGGFALMGDPFQDGTGGTGAGPGRAPAAFCSAAVAAAAMRCRAAAPAAPPAASAAPPMAIP